MSGLEHAWLRVGDEWRLWPRGELLVFDDAFEHEVINDTAAERAVLLFDVWHPELTADEIAAIQAMFDEVERRRAAREAEGAS